MTHRRLAEADLLRRARDVLVQEQGAKRNNQVRIDAAKLHDESELRWLARVNARTYSGVRPRARMKRTIASSSAGERPALPGITALRPRAAPPRRMTSRSSS